ncbi:helix-turn-helix domain-containing protein [Citrobacter freundii]|nr:helix-turn-helix domain-containing protein [Citrobacter freundii]MBC6509556.1 helix-turn-helix domain-containing protein [Citrobacter freundii]
MHSPLIRKSGKVTVIYSADFIIGRALEGLFEKDIKGRRKRHFHTVQNADALFSHILTERVDSVVLNISARENTRLLCAIRRYSPALPVIITGHHHLFSDHVVAGWFGNIWLQEYNSLLAGYPDITPDTCVSDTRFAGTACSGACGHRCPGGRNTFSALQHWLGERFRQRVSSRRGAAIVLDWLAPGLSPQEAASELGRSVKVVYHYRWRIMRELGLRSPAFELIPSVTLKEGDEPAGSLRKCRMQEKRSDNL